MCVHTCRKDNRLSRKKLIGFYGNITRMSPEKLTNRIVASFLSKKINGAWFTEVETELQEVRIMCKDIQEHDSLKKIEAYGKMWNEEINKTNAEILSKR